MLVQIHLNPSQDAQGPRRIERRKQPYKRKRLDDIKSTLVWTSPSIPTAASYLYSYVRRWEGLLAGWLVAVDRPCVDDDVRSPFPLASFQFVPIAPSMTSRKFPRRKRNTDKRKSYV